MLSELALVITILVSAADLVQPRVDVPFQVIVHRSNAVSSLSRAELSAIFMRRTRSWPDRTEVRPVEPPARSRVREQFSRAIHGKSVAYVTRYWHRVIFAGRGVPPEELASDEAVIELVKTHRGAIGYIARETQPGDGVKVLAVTR
jgi:ABC-type phosphate transport system substrate-binding protein